MGLRLIRKAGQSVIISASRDLTQQAYITARVRDVQIRQHGWVYSVEPRKTLLELEFFAPAGMMIVRHERYLAEHGAPPKNQQFKLAWHHVSRRSGQSVLISATPRMLAPEHIEVKIISASVFDETGASIVLPPSHVCLDLEIVAPNGLHVQPREVYENVLRNESFDWHARNAA